MAQENSDIAIDNEILAELTEVNRNLSAIARRQGGADLQIFLELSATVKDLSTKLEVLNRALLSEKQYSVEVKVDGADGAIHDLVSRVMEEVIIRIKQENLLTVTNV